MYWRDVVILRAVVTDTDADGYPAEAVKVMADLGAAQALGLHWGTFQLTDEAREAPVAALADALAAAGVPPERFPALEAGETLELSPGR